jgi:hypothetical protein
MKQPIQPLYKTETGQVRFHPNAIVDFLYEWCKSKGMGMNELAMMNFSKEDRQQFAQLIGYSLCGYGELQSYVDDDAYNQAELMYRENLTEEQAKIKHLETELYELRKALKEPMARLFGKCPEDLME